MKDWFVTDNFKIDLTGLRINFTEENPRFKDTLWTKYTLPVDINYDRDFFSKVGQYSSFNNANLAKVHTGYHIFEGRTMKGTLTFSEFRNKTAKIQIDSGFEELPNFEKNLSELPLDVFEVPDIYDHANEIVEKKYPETNYNFPKLYTNEFDLDSEGWKYFDSFINNRVRSVNSVTKYFPRNEIQENGEGWDCINRNIIQPVPYLLHVLKQGFLDAGFILTGDILEDETLKQRCIYSGEQYFTTADQKYYKSYIFQNEYYGNYDLGSLRFAHWTKKFKIGAPGKYRIIGSCYREGDLGNSSLTIYKNDVPIISYGGGNTPFLNFDQVIEIDITEAETNPEIRFEFNGIVKDNRFNSEGVNIGIAEIQINPIRQNTAAGDAIPFVFNFNRVDLKRAVPDMTFGELINMIKNWRNYDLTFVNGIAIMNRIVIDKTKEPDDFREFEIEDPIRSRNDKQYFNITFPKIDGVELDDVFFDESGYRFNVTPVPKDTTQIDINGFCLPLTTFRATTTAKTFQETSTLMLVYYDGLDSNGDNHAKNPAGLHGTEFAESVKDWFMNRLTNFTFRWTFFALKSKIRKFNIRSEIFAYNKKHWIKSWVKNSVSDKYYSVEIETETF